LTKIAFPPIGTGIAGVPIFKFCTGFVNGVK